MRFDSSISLAVSCSLAAEGVRGSEAVGILEAERESSADDERRRAAATLALVEQATLAFFATAAQTACDVLGAVEPEAAARALQLELDSGGSEAEAAGQGAAHRVVLALSEGPAPRRLALNLLALRCGFAI